MGQAQEKAEGHNGWKNYETWVVALWIDNDESTYNERRRMCRAAEREAQDDSGCMQDECLCHDMSASRQYGPCNLCGCLWRSASGTLADELQRWVTDDLMPDLGASLAADLLGAALSEVDWHEIADNFLSE